eukprot:CAMPEP_0117661930 /NCGR_PEP_ID=MMETSP0804-20121206/7794_1 /TAXON_ID=1074897 /ORGANISM="Tetraselmis astigmatica, Strain CCMP880" /LENGTH=1034 /DNA_ID=CAMNT_0005468819 /DNA_START=449 /DNA_END=3550 /DNA_ORIENTATION=-
MDEWGCRGSIEWTGRPGRGALRQRPAAFSTQAFLPAEESFPEHLTAGIAACCVDHLEGGGSGCCRSSGSLAAVLELTTALVRQRKAAAALVRSGVARALPPLLLILPASEDGVGDKAVAFRAAVAAAVLAEEGGSAAELLLIAEGCIPPLVALCCYLCEGPRGKEGEDRGGESGLQAAARAAVSALDALHPAQPQFWEAMEGCQGPLAVLRFLAMEGSLGGRGSHSPAAAAARVLCECSLSPADVAAVDPSAWRFVATALESVMAADRPAAVVLTSKLLDSCGASTTPALLAALVSSSRLITGLATPPPPEELAAGSALAGAAAEVLQRLLLVSATSGQLYTAAAVASVAAAVSPEFSGGGHGAEAAAQLVAAVVVDAVRLAPPSLLHPQKANPATGRSQGNTEGIREQESGEEMNAEAERENDDDEVLELLSKMLQHGGRHSVLTAAAILAAIFSSNGAAAGSCLAPEQAVPALLELSVREGPEGTAAALALLALFRHGGSAAVAGKGLAPLLVMLRVAEEERGGGPEGVVWCLEALIHGFRAAELAVACGAVDSCVALLVRARHDESKARVWVAVALLLGELAASGGEAAEAAMVDSGAVLGIVAVVLEFAGERFWDGVGAAAWALRRMAGASRAAVAMAEAGVAGCLAGLLLEEEAASEGGLPAGHPFRLAALETLLLLASDPDLQPLVVSEAAAAGVAVLKQRCRVLSIRKGEERSRAEDGAREDWDQGGKARGTGRGGRFAEEGVEGGGEAHGLEWSLRHHCVCCFDGGDKEAAAATRLLLSLASHDSRPRQAVAAEGAAETLLALVRLEEEAAGGGMAGLVLGCLALDDRRLQKHLPSLGLPQLTTAPSSAAGTPFLQPSPGGCSASPPAFPWPQGLAAPEWPAQADPSVAAEQRSVELLVAMLSHSSPQSCQDAAEAVHFLVKDSTAAAAVCQCGGVAALAQALLAGDTCHPASSAAAGSVAAALSRLAASHPAAWKEVAVMLSSSGRLTSILPRLLSCRRLSNWEVAAIADLVVIAAEKLAPQDCG